jgi:hypothetical protein
MQTVANLAGSSSVQEQVNAASAVRLRAYHESYARWLAERWAAAEVEPQRGAAGAGGSGQGAGEAVGAAEAAEAAEAARAAARGQGLRRDLAPLDALLGQLQQLVDSSRREKCVAILALSARLCRRLHGGRVTVCKSAKDRTSMAVTLEQARLAQESHGLREADVAAVTEGMRRHGVRRANSGKNTGKEKYCFNPLQRMLLPHEYQPPAGTGGGGKKLS